MKAPNPVNSNAMLEPGLDRRIAEIRERIARAAERGGRGQQTAIIAVTKTHGPDAPTAAYNAGIADVGENKVQEALGKMDQVSVPVRWHLIGHLQRNKVKSLDRFVLFHALDSSRLADAIDRFGVESGRPVEVLMQVNPAREETKGGFDLNEVAAEAERLASMKGLVVRGAMTIARMGADESELRETFGAVRETNRILAGAGHPATELSMGMSGDYELAVEEGATMVRLGSILFGERGK
jgi:pyridoxal phosphate enzyme (YggS family)